jgi:phospholipid/cholesterol/gamma-HCH transport system substrate-binding protein
MYRALDDIAVTLGPKAGSTDGALDALLTAGEKALKGNGELGSETIRNLSQAADTFARNRGPLFDNVRSLAELTETLAANDTAVQSFLTELTSVSGQLEGERDELRDVLASLARVLGTVKGFIKENREVLGDDIELLSSLLERVDNQKDAVGLVLQKGALAMGNLAVAFEPGTGTFGSRVQVGPAFSRLDLFLCQTIANTGDFSEEQAAQTCSLFKNLLGPLIPKAPEGTEGAAEPALPESAPTTGPAPTILPEQSGLRNGKLPDLFSLLGGERE